MTTANTVEGEAVVSRKTGFGHVVRSIAHDPWATAGVVAIVVFVLVGVIVEMTGVVGVQIGASRRYDGFGKSDRAFVVGAIGLFHGLGWVPLAWIGWMLWIAGALGAVAIVTRARRALQEVRSEGDAG
jgi:CDP-diacylglycerol--glycerol-3-phosphate 3-phosphatidyltransferase